MLTEEDSKQANIQGIHCIIRPPQGIEDGVLVNFSFDFRKKEVSFFFLSLPVSYFLACICTLSIYLYWTFPPPSCITINLFTLNMIHPIPQITPKHSEHITSATSTHVHCLAYTQAKDFFFFIIPLSCWFLAFAIYYYFFCIIENHKKRSWLFFFFFWNVFYTFVKYEPADISSA